ncbi:hypothetical protein BC834DRAFT_1028685 [Gloeopeniophorella convolvens]|nr:hypothetical protein BC834DRAFT_1028685 [Gloeopeniophorella convolvens]
MDQVVLSPVYALARKDTSLWAHPLLIPSYAAAASAGILVLQATFSSGPVKRLRARVFNTTEEDTVTGEPDGNQTRTGIISAVKEHVDKSGGSIIFLFQTLRLISVLTLLGLAIFSFVQDEEEHAAQPSVGAFSKHWGKKHKHKHRYGGGSFSKREWLDLTLCITYLYTSFLALFAVTARRTRSSIASFHLSLVLLVTFSVYTYRDIWPLITYTLVPADKREGTLLWIKLSVLSFAAVFIPLVMPYRYVPVDPKDPQSALNPEQTASILSLSMYSFLDPIVFQAYRVPHLSHDMLPPLADYDYTKNLVKRSFKHLDSFSGSPKRHIFWGLMRVFNREYIQLALLLIIKTFSSLMAPVGMNQLLRYIETHGKDAVVRPWVWIAYLFLGPALGTIAFQWYIFIATGSLVRVTAIITQLIFEHALRIRVKAEASSPLHQQHGATTPDNASAADITISANGEETAPSTSSVKGKQREELTPTADKDKDKDDEPGKGSNLVGKMNNLVSTDLENLIDGRDFLLLTLYLPLQVILCVWFLYSILGWSAFVGMGAMVALFPVPGAVANKIQKVQKETLKRTDARVQSATETMSVLRMIKLFGWEPKIADRLAEKREQELRYIKIRQILNLINGNINFIIPVITMVISYVTFTAVMKKPLSPSIVFSSMAAFDLLRDQLHSVFWMIPMFTQAKVSLDRVNDFLHDTELLDEYADAEKGTERVMLTDASHFDHDVIGFQNASFTWSNDEAADGTLTPSRRRFTLRIRDELLFKRGCLNLIVGPTGSGKTSLLMALLGEMHFIPLSPDAWFHLPREGGVSYAAQESWVQNETIRDNILFGAPYDEERYNKVIFQCGLKRDLSLFEAGDKTEVGEKGLTLSGGQKARVTLARAVYSSAEILLLDDVLAALDVHTARWIVEKCFKGDLIRGRTVLLVTHNVAMATPIADYVVSLGPDGQIASRGSVSDALAKDKTLAAELKEEEHAMKNDDKEIDAEEPDKASKQADGKLILAEEVAEGHVSRDAIKLFVGGLGGAHVFLFWLVFVGGLVLCDALLSIQTWFMGYWAEQYEIYPPEEVRVGYYLTIYSTFIIGAILSFTIGSSVYVFGALRASRSIHKRLIESVLGTTLRWLDTTPTSRVITRVTQDIRALDGPIANTFTWFIEITVTMLIKFFAVIYLTPIFLIPGVLITVVGAWTGQVYMKAQIAIKREMSNAKAPVVGHFGAAVSGLTSIRAYGAQLAFRNEAYKRIDKYSRAGRSFYNMNRWVSLRIDFLGGIFAAGLAAYLIYMPGQHALPSDTGFSLTMAIGFSGLILWWIRIFNDFEVNSNSLERMHAYINIEQEVKPTKDGVPPAYWPASGDLRVEKLSARYSADGPKVLHEISFHIQSGERVGVVGRTGSGKSSLTLSLLRCIFTEGEVYYDGKPTSSLNLDALRTAITIIPQTPELLSGTLRENLDPFSQYDDATLNAALRASGLFSLQSDDDEGRLTLDSSIASGGGNLSVGQRQILALARAIVRGSKLLILDEDYKTDTIIQTSLRNELKGDVTLITVAHRLQTIMDADKIMVLDAGRIVEFGKPSELLKDKGGRLRSLVDESGDRDALYAMAAEKPTDTYASVASRAAE